MNNEPFDCYTDYPFKELGDTPFHVAPVRRVTVIGYDWNKYATIVVNGFTTSVKIGYLFHNRHLDLCVTHEELIEIFDRS